MLKFSRLTTSGNIVKVYVGEIEKLWYIHEDLLCERSEYFKKAFKGSFKEGQEKEIHLAEIDPTAFGQLVDWVYGAPLHVTVSTAGRDAAPSAAEFEQVFLFCKIYAAAQYLRMENLQNDVMDMYSSYIKSTGATFDAAWYVASDHVEYIYTNTTRPSPMHQFMARLVAKAILKTSMTSHWDSVMEQCPAFGVDIVLKIQKSQKGEEQDAFNVPRCTFHVHECTAVCDPSQLDVQKGTSQRPGKTTLYRPRFGS
jgi:BTB/POZ domain